MATLLSIVGFALMLLGLGGLLLRHAVLSSAPHVIVLQALAVALLVWARVTFGRRSFHATAPPTEGGLVTTGPYRWVRHPIYTALCLFTWACVLGHLSALSVAAGVVVTLGAGLRMVAEETLLPTRYPEYVEYARKTKRVLPYIF